VGVDVPRLVRVLPCAFCGYEFDHDSLGKYGCPNCESEGLGEITENGTKQKIQKNSAYCHKGQSAENHSKQAKMPTIRKAVCYNGAAMKTKHGYKVEYKNETLGHKMDYFFSSSRGLTPLELAKERVQFLKDNKFTDRKSIKLSTATRTITGATPIHII